MTHKDIYKWFKHIFPQYSERLKEWFPNGKDSIRIRLETGRDFVFTYHNREDWRFETVDSFIKQMKGAKNMTC